MEFKYKLIAVAVLALLSGTAFAAPMLVAPLDVQPYPRVPEGPKATFSIDIVYANFSLTPSQRNITDSVPHFGLDGSITYVNRTRTLQDTNVSYTVVANITNVSDNIGYMYEAGFDAAHNIRIIDSALGGGSFSLGSIPDKGPNYGGVVDAVYLDGKWLNTTWIPGNDYPYNVMRILDSQHTAQSTIPSLPENASENGMWIEGVPIAEYYSSTDLEATHIYINGAWVDVTGRVQPYNPTPMVISTNTLANLVLTPSVPLYSGSGNASDGLPMTKFSGWYMGGGMGQALRWIGGRGFDRAWLPHQSRLIMFTGNTTLNSESAGVNQTVTLMDNGQLDLYGSVTSYITNMPVNGTYTDTVYSAFCIKTVPLQKTTDGYLYNAALSPNQYFQVRADGVELYIKQVDPQ
jgi:hypothetical protein